MGVIFQRVIPDESVENAIAMNIQPQFEAALRETIPASDAMVSTRADTLAAAAARRAAPAAKPVKLKIQWKPFAVALGLFFVLLGIAIFLDWKNVVDDPKVYSGMVT